VFRYDQTIPSALQWQRNYSLHSEAPYRGQFDRIKRGTTVRHCG